MSFASIQRRIDALTAEMLKASEAEDFESAARLRNEIQQLKGQDESGSPLVRQPPPGEMGLGTHIPKASPRKHWHRPRPPDPMTRNVKKGKR